MTLTCDSDLWSRFHAWRLRRTESMSVFIYISCIIKPKIIFLVSSWQNTDDLGHSRNFSNGTHIVLVVVLEKYLFRFLSRVLFFFIYFLSLFFSLWNFNFVERHQPWSERIFVYFCIFLCECFVVFQTLVMFTWAVLSRAQKVRYLSSHPQWLMLQAFHSDPHEKAQNSQNQAWFRYKNTIIKLIFWNLSPDSVILMKIKCGPVFTLNFHLFLHFCTLKLMPSHLICPTCPKETALNNFHNNSCASPADAKG